MGSAEEEVTHLKEMLDASVKKVSQLYGSQDRLMKVLIKKTAETGEAHQRVRELEERDIEKTKTIRHLKRRLSKNPKEIIIEY